MADLSVEYLGLKLRNPIIVGSSGLTAKTESIRNLEQNGAAAVVLKSLFEEEIILGKATSISQMLYDLESWMDKHGFSTIDDFRGKVSQEKGDNPAAFERVQFMKYFRGFTG